MFKKIITYFLILAVILPIFASAIPFGGSVKRAYAEDSDKSTMADPCDLFGAGMIGEALLRFVGNDIIDKIVDSLRKKSPANVSMWNCATYTLTYLLYDLVMQNAIRLAGLASDLFNVSIQFSLTSNVFDVDRNVMIKDGWTMIRDLFNLVFIFILLYAAIATILQLNGVDIKKILPGLIIAALLVNFSLMISKVVIDASHIFSFAFYDQIDATDGNKYPNMGNAINVNGNFEKKNLANVFLAGFNPQSLLTGKIKKTETTDDKGNKVIKEENVESEWFNVLGYARKEGETFTGTLSRMVLIILLETALAIFSAFILLIVATMFIARIVILWMVMIFSPVAFIGMVLPSMNKYSKMWWDYLINQSFFAPAFLFMFMLSTKFVNSEMMSGLLNITKNGDISLATGMDGGGIVSTFLHFAIVAILMGGSLYVAKMLGGKSAELAEKGRAFALGGANFAFRKSGTRGGLRLLGGTVGDSNLFTKSIGRLPGGNILGRKLGAMKKADEDKMRKEGEKYAGILSSSGRKSLDVDKERSFFGRALYGGGLFKPTREGYEKIIAKKDEEKKEKELYHESWAYLLGDLKPGEDYSSEEGKKNKKKKIEDIEGRIRRGELGLMEEEVEKLQKERTMASEKAKEENSLEIKKNEREIRVLEAQQAELYKEGKHSAMKEASIDELDRAIAKLNKTNAEMTVTEKLFERHEKRTESYRSRQELKGKPSEEKKPEKKKN